MRDELKVKMIRILADQLASFMKEAEKNAKEEKNPKMAGYYSGKMDGFYLAHRWIMRDILGEDVPPIKFPE